jgi:hypothetical protein
MKPAFYTEASLYTEALRYYVQEHSRDAQTHRERAEINHPNRKRQRPHQHNALISGARAELALWHLRRCGA